MHVLVTGGAGYIGSHTVKALKKAGYTVSVLDSLENGHLESLDSLVEKQNIFIGNLLDTDFLNQTFRNNNFDAVMHFAAYALVGESVEKPGKYFWNNTAGTTNLLNAMIEHGVNHFVFSSTCAVYGQPEVVPITEDTAKHPENPYGLSKLLSEQVIQEIAQASPLKATALRYFNACGADREGKLGEDHAPESHLIPLILQVALGQRQEIKIFGTDYPTPDGTAVRDYIHVEDLASAHIKALEQQKQSENKFSFYNLGTGKGYSVKEVIETCRQVTGHAIPAVETDRRPGDPPELVANPAKANKELEWNPECSDLETIIQTAWNWHKTKKD